MRALTSPPPRHTQQPNKQVKLTTPIHANFVKSIRAKLLGDDLAPIRRESSTSPIKVISPRGAEVNEPATLKDASRYTFQRDDVNKPRRTSQVAVAKPTEPTASQISKPTPLANNKPPTPRSGSIKKDPTSWIKQPTSNNTANQQPQPPQPAREEKKINKLVLPPLPAKEEPPPPPPQQQQPLASNNSRPPKPTASVAKVSLDTTVPSDANASNASSSKSLQKVSFKSATPSESSSFLPISVSIDKTRLSTVKKAAPPVPEALPNKMLEEDEERDSALNESAGVLHSHPLRVKSVFNLFRRASTQRKTKEPAKEVEQPQVSVLCFLDLAVTLILRTLSIINVLWGTCNNVFKAPLNPTPNPKRKSIFQRASKPAESPIPTKDTSHVSNVQPGNKKAPFRVRMFNRLKFWRNQRAEDMQDANDSHQDEEDDQFDMMGIFLPPSIFVAICLFFTFQTHQLISFSPPFTFKQSKSNTHMKSLAHW